MCQRHIYVHSNAENKIFLHHRTSETVSIVQFTKAKYGYMDLLNRCNGCLCSSGWLMFPMNCKDKERRAPLGDRTIICGRGANVWPRKAIYSQQEKKARATWNECTPQEIWWKNTKIVYWITMPDKR